MVLSVCLSVTPFWLCSHHRIIMKFSGVITNDQSKVHAKLQVQQNKLLKLLTKRDYRYSTNKLHQENRILKVKHIHELYTLAFVFPCHKDTPIEPFKDYFKRRGETHGYELRNNENLSTNKICLNTGKTTTHTTGALLWNNCPTNITDLNEIGPFKKKLSEYYFQMYQD